jgi:large-conductance mechanosensitive channel
VPRKDNKVQKSASAMPFRRPGNLISTFLQFILIRWIAFMVRQDFPKANESQEEKLEGYPEKAGYMSSMWELLFLPSIFPHNPSR